MTRTGDMAPMFGSTSEIGVVGFTDLNLHLLMISSFSSRHGGHGYWGQKDETSQPD